MYIGGHNSRRDSQGTELDEALEELVHPFEMLYKLTNNFNLIGVVAPQAL